jgi:hypothetical protein
MRVLSLSFFALSIAVGGAWGQTQPGPAPVEKKGIVYNSAYAFGGQIFTNGWAAHFEWAKIQTLHRRNFYQIEIAQVRHPKETRQPSDFANYGLSIPAVNPPKPFVYGKRNNFYQVNASMGQERMIGQRAEKSGVEVSFKYMAGFSLGILKPYYLQYLVPTEDPQERYFVEDKYSAETHPYFLDRTWIYGAAPMSKGFDEPKLVPGGHIKAGLKFDWAFFEEYIKAIEVGGVVDIYPRRVPIMITEKNQRVFPNLYLGLQFGRKKA